MATNVKITGILISLIIYETSNDLLKHSYSQKSSPMVLTSMGNYFRPIQRHSHSLIRDREPRSNCFVIFRYLLA